MVTLIKKEGCKEAGTEERNHTRQERHMEAGNKGNTEKHHEGSTHEKTGRKALESEDKMKAGMREGTKEGLKEGQYTGRELTKEVNEGGQLGKTT